MKKTFFILIASMVFFLFHGTVFAKQITSVVTNDSVVITVDCKICNNPVPGFITVKNRVGGAIQKQTFTNLKNGNPLAFTFKNLQLNSTYDVEVWSNTDPINDDGIHNYIKDIFKTPLNQTGPPPGPGHTVQGKIDIIKSGTSVDISVTCHAECNGLKGKAIVTGDNYNQTSIEKSLIKDKATIYTFNGLTKGKTYTAKSFQLMLPDGTEYVWKTPPFTMDDVNSGPGTTTIDIQDSCPAYEVQVQGVCTCQEPNKKDATTGGVCMPGSLYHFLAPLKCDAGTPGCVDGQLKTFNASQRNALGTYLNIMIKILIGVAAVLAVIMIVMGGIQYMTSELVSSKEEGKKRITNALIGLLIALGAYILLYTINPNLLKIEPNADVFTNTYLNYQEEESLVAVPGSNNKGGSTANCVGGLVTISSTGAPFKPGVGNEKICVDLVPTLVALKSKISGWYVTSAVSRGHLASCHGYGNKGSVLTGDPRTGNCFDISNIDKGSYGTKIPNGNPYWGDLCKAINSLPGINYINEASNNPSCGNSKIYSTSTGANLHIYKVK